MALLQFEAPLLRPPFEQLERTTRNVQKIVAKEMTTAATHAKALVAKTKAAKQAPAAKEQAVKTLSAVVSTLQGLKRKLEEHAKASEKCLHKTAARIDHIEALEHVHRAWQANRTARRNHSNGAAPVPGSASRPANGSSSSAGNKRAKRTGSGVAVPAVDSDEQDRSAVLEELYAAATQKRLDRIFADHLLREGFYTTAQNLVNEAKLGDLVDVDLFVSARRVLDGLLPPHGGVGDVTRALMWCGENRSKLTRMNSPLEFNLRVQEFVELLRAQRLLDAVSYSQKHFGGFAVDHASEIQHVMALVAFLPAIIGPTPGSKDEKEKDKAAGGAASGMDVDAAAVRPSPAASPAVGPMASPLLTPALTAASPFFGPGASPMIGAFSINASPGLAPLASPAASPALGPLGAPAAPPRLLARSSSVASTASEVGDGSATPSAAAGGSIFGSMSGGLVRSHSDPTGAAAKTDVETKGPSEPAKPDPFQPYRRYFEASRWVELATQFRTAFYSLHGLTAQSLFDVHLQAGLWALKTPRCVATTVGAAVAAAAHSAAAAAGTSASASASVSAALAVAPPDPNDQCPCCCTSPPIHALAAKLPVAQRVHSRVVCRLSGAVMDEHNPPLVLPNGYVYSRAALAAMAAASLATAGANGNSNRSGSGAVTSGSGTVTCPRTKQTFPFDQCRVAYVL